MSCREVIESVLSRRANLSRRWEVSVVGLAIALAVGMHLWIGLRTDFIPCTLDCGETFEAYVGARNIDRFGWRYAGGLQDYSSSPDQGTHQTLYVHNPNLGMHYFWLLFKLGVRGVHAHAAWMTLPFVVGLAYLYATVKAIAHDGVLGALCLLSASSLYLLVGLWGFDAVRTWSFLLTWGMLYHLWQGFTE